MKSKKLVLDVLSKDIMVSRQRPNQEKLDKSEPLCAVRVKRTSREDEKTVHIHGFFIKTYKRFYEHHAFPVYNSTVTCE